MEVQTWQIERVAVADRTRQSVGDLASLKASMERLGQLHPIAARPDGTLVFGARRLAAAKELGWTEIAVQLFTSGSAEKLLRAELDENTERLDLAPVEAARLRRRIAEFLKPEAERRHAEGSARGGRSEGSGNLPQPSEKVRDLAAKPTGYSGRTLDEVDKILNTAEDPNEEPEVREEAKRQAEVLSGPDGKRKVSSAAAKVRKARERKRDHDLLPGQKLQQPAAPPPDLPLERRLTDGINKGRDLKTLAGEIQDRDDLDLTDDTIKALQRRLRSEAADRTTLAKALGSVLTKRKSNK